MTNPAEHRGVKQPGLSGAAWFDEGAAKFSSSSSSSRKRAAAQIAKIPLPLARHIGRTFYPEPAANFADGGQRIAA